MEIEVYLINRIVLLQNEIIGAARNGQPTERLGGGLAELEFMLNQFNEANKPKLELVENAPE